MINYAVIRIDAKGVICDVAIFPDTEYKTAQYVQELAKQVYPQHNITLEIAFSNSWDHVKESERYQEFIGGKP